MKEGENYGFTKTELKELFSKSGFQRTDRLLQFRRE